LVNGHDHDHERSKPMRGMTVGGSNADGTVYLVGSAGAPLYDKGSDVWTAFSEKMNSFAVVRVQRGMIMANAYHADGTMLDGTTLIK
jgi:hypothetical protein